MGGYCIQSPQMRLFVSLMATASKTQVLEASRRWLNPVVHVLLKCGVTYKEFAEAARGAYVDVASRKFGRRGRPTNVSRVALLTGLARREVRRQREALENRDHESTGLVTKGSLALSAWHQLAPFADAQGRPRPLSFDGASPSFTELARHVGASDVAPATLLKELKSAGAVEELADGRLRALARNFIPHSLDATLIRLWGSVLGDIANTYEHNLLRAPATVTRFERAAVNGRIDPDAVPAFREFLEREGQAFLERADAWLTAHQIDDTGDATTGVRLGVGVYHVQD